MADSSLSSTSPASAHRRLTFAVLISGSFFVNLGFQVWRSLFNNFAHDELGLQGGAVSVVQAVRELPGLMGFVVGFLALLLPEMQIMGLSIALMGVGIAFTGAVHSLTGLLASTVLMSAGFHFFMPCNSSSVLTLVGKEEAPHTLGKLNSLNALFTVMGAGVVFLAFGTFGFRPLYYVIGAVVAVGGLALLPWGRRATCRVRAEGRTPVRREYWLYYVLEFLMGSRRHIFTTFAPFLLVEAHAVSPQTLTFLFVINNLAGTLLFRQFGRIIARFGERRILSLNFALLILVFLGYAYLPWAHILFALFVVDHMLFGFRMALESYFQKVAIRPEEITPTLARGQTINHVAAVILPLIGGVMWEAIGSRYTFLIGVGVAAVSLVLVQWMRTTQGHVPAAGGVSR
jgi:predicted MFS family arabinose efflux permease